MKNKRRFLTILVVILMLLSHTTVFASAVSENLYYNCGENTEFNDVSNDSHYSCCSNSDASNEILYFNNNNEFVDAKQKNIASLILHTDKKLKEISYEELGFNVVSCRYESGLVYIEYTYNNEYAKPQLNVMAQLEDNSILSTSLYGYYYEDIVFLSGASKDDAFEKYCLYLLNNDKIDEKQYKSMRNTYYAQSITITTSESQQLSTSQIQGGAEIQASGSTTYLRGVIVWNDDRGIEHPCQYIKVNIYDKEEIIADQLIATTYTSAGGFYSISFENDQSFFEFGNDLFIEIIAEGEGVSVKNNNGVTYSVSTRDVALTNVSNGYTYDINVKFEMCENGNFVGGDLGRAIQVSQPAIVASRYAKAMNGSAMPNVDVCYPANDDNCKYYYDEKLIKIIHQGADEDDPASYASWDVIMHEYGHHVQSYLEIHDNPGGDHFSHENDIDIERFTDEERKAKGVKLAWAESWPTVFGIMAQQYYINQLSNIETVGDKYYTTYNTDYSIDYEVFCLGEGCERAIMYFLYDLYDADSTYENHDLLALGHNKMWNLVKSSGAKTFFDFVSYLTISNEVSIDNLGKLLAMCGMAVINVSVEAGETPSFVWEGYGGSYKHPYNSFRIVFATETNAEIFTTNEISTNEYTLTSEEWECLLSSGSTTIKYRVLSSEISNYSTGPYSTAWYTLDVPTATTLNLNTPLSGYLPTSDDYVWYRFTSTEGGYYRFYTEGTTDTVGELYSEIPYDDSTDGMLAYSDDGHMDSEGNNANMGFVYELSEGETVYIKVRPYVMSYGYYTIYVEVY